MPAAALGQHETLLICYLRRARDKARAAAEQELLQLLHAYQIREFPGGPLSEQGGIFWMALPVEHIPAITSYLPRLGYTQAVDMLEPMLAPTADHAADAETRVVRWRRKPYRLIRLYEENPDELRERAPDRRTFLLWSEGVGVRPVRGYRGDGEPLSRRGLPVYDARLLVNLVAASPGSRFLDPFAGIGGVVLEGLASGYSVLSCDIDPVLRYGLAGFGAQHFVADAAHLPLAAASVDMIATEPPFHEQANQFLQRVLDELVRVLRPTGRISLLCAAEQAPLVTDAASRHGLELLFESPINRKGLDVVVFVWQKLPGAV